VSESCKQFIVSRKQDGSPHIQRNEPIEDLMNPVQWAKVKEYCAARGTPFVGIVHCFKSESGDISVTYNTDSIPPSSEDTRLMDDALLTVRFADLFLENLQHSRCLELQLAYECKDCAEGKELHV
jgi:hypothetical protein